MRIGYLIPEFPGQTHIFFWREIQELRQRGVDVDIISTRRPPRGIISHRWSQEAMDRTIYLSELDAAGVTQTATALLRSGPAGWTRCAASLLRADGISVAGRARLGAVALLGARLAEIGRRRGWTHLHVHSCADSAHLALFAKLLSGLSYSLTLHGNLDRFGTNHREKWRHAEFAVVVNHVLLDEVNTTLAGALPAAVVVAPMGVDTERCRRQTPYAPWRGEGPLRIVSCGRLNPVKGHADLIAAVQQLRSEGLDARLEILGQDDQGGTGYRHDLEALIARGALQGVVVLRGALSEEGVFAALEGAHLFALASLWEAVGVATVEAMAMSVPSVVTGVGGVPELISDGVDGLLIPPQNPAALAAALGRVARNPDLAQRLAAAGRDKVEREFHSGRSAAAIASLLAEAPGFPAPVFA
ncbi:MAG: exopolysaccharide biosynthesis GT4 family glycosyltransferase EpsE [Acidobacteriota bacterium]